MSSKALRIIPLGGVGTFGMNCTVLESGNSMIVVDAGLKVPQGNLPGVDLILPDFSYVIDNARRVAGIFLTHGHDDHIGGLPYLLREVQVPVYGTALTLALVRERLAAAARDGAQNDILMRQILFTESVKCGPFIVEAVRVSHSIPDGAALIIRTPAGTVVHSGDFKMDPTPLNGHLTDEDRLTRVGDEGVLCLLCDSTNADRAGTTPSEKDVSEVLVRIIDGAPGRVFVATFASHIHRIQSVLDAAHRAGRKVVLEGRRMIANCELAAAMGYLRYPPGTLASADRIEGTDGKVVFLVTGTQGEPMSALSRIVKGEHPLVGVRRGDTVIFSSRIIPGNELTTGQMIDELYRKGAEVYYQDPPRVHASGHGSAEEILRMIRAVRPRIFIPIHGDYRQMAACSRLGREAGIAEGCAFLMEAGHVLELRPEGAGLADPVNAGQILVDGDLMTAVGGSLLKDRRRLAREGVVLVAVSLPRDGERAAFEPDVHSVGVAPDLISPELDAEAARTVTVLLSDRDGSSSLEELKENIRLVARSVYRKAIQKRPHVVVVALEE